MPVYGIIKRKYRKKKTMYDFKEVEENLTRMVREGKIAGASAAVYLAGSPVFEVSCGYADLEKKIALSPKSVFRLASMTKPVTAAAVLICRERGWLALEDPVSRYLPAFQDTFLAGKKRGHYERGRKNPVPVTVLHLLTHSSGIGSGEPVADFYCEAKPREGDTLAAAVQRYADFPLEFIPGTAQSYSPVMALDVAARIVEIVSGMPYAAFLEKNIFLPLGMRNTGYSRAAFAPGSIVVSYRHEDGRLLRDPLEEHNFDDFPADYPGGGAGLMATAEDYARFASMLACMGELDGVRILRRESVGLMQKPWLPQSVAGITDWFNWGLGVRTLSKTIPGQPLAPGSFGWSGAYGTHFWAEPARRLAAVYMHNSLTYGGAGAPHMNLFEEGVMRALGR